MKLIILFIIVSCGNTNQATRCYSKYEAMLACQVEKISELAMTLDQAKTICQPFYQVDACYPI